MLGRIVRFLITLSAIVILAGSITFAWIACRVNYTGTRDHAQRADAIIVLGARVEPDGQPGPDLRSRTLHAVGLFRRGLAPYLICTGGYPNEQSSAASVARRLAIQQGVPADKVVRADGSMSTSEDAARASALMAEQGWRTAILVSHPLHLERARLLFEAEGIEVFSSPTSTDLAAIPLRTRAWLTCRETVAIVWIAMEPLGLPDAWALPLNR